MRISKLISTTFLAIFLQSSFVFAQDCKCPVPNIAGLEHRINKMYYDSVRCTERDGEISCVFSCNYALKGTSSEIIVSVAWVKKLKPNSWYTCSNMPEQYSIRSANSKLAFGRPHVAKPTETLHQEAIRMAEDLISQVEPAAALCPGAKPNVKKVQEVNCPSGYGDYRLQTVDPSKDGIISTIKSGGGDLNTIGCTYQNVNTKRIIKIEGKWFSSQPSASFALSDACGRLEKKNIVNSEIRQALVSATQAEEVNNEIAKNISSDLLGRIIPYAVLCPGLLPPKNQPCYCPPTYADYKLEVSPNIGVASTMNWGEGAKVQAIHCSYRHKTDRLKSFSLTLQWAIQPALNSNKTIIGCNEPSFVKLVHPSKQLVAYLNTSGDPDHMLMAKIIAERMMAEAASAAIPCPGKLKAELTSAITSKGTVKGKIISKTGTIEIYYPVLNRWVEYDGTSPYLYLGQRIRTGESSFVTFIFINSNGEEEYINLSSNMSMNM